MFDLAYTGLSTIIYFAGLVAVGFAVLGFIDALRRSEGDFELIGKGQRTAWLIGLVIAGVIVFSSGVNSLLCKMSLLIGVYRSFAVFLLLMICPVFCIFC
jgi:hypothetical protein